MYRFKVIWRWKYSRTRFRFCYLCHSFETGTRPSFNAEMRSHRSEVTSFQHWKWDASQFQSCDTVSKKVLYFKKKFLKFIAQKLHVKLYEKRKKSRICITFRHYHSGKFRSCKLPFFSPIACIISMRWWHAVLSLAECENHSLGGCLAISLIQ